jgi:hypothetical protein
MFKDKDKRDCSHFIKFVVFWLLCWISVKVILIGEKRISSAVKVRRNMLQTWNNVMLSVKLSC